MYRSSSKRSNSKRSTSLSEPPKEIRQYISAELWNAMPKARQRECVEILRTPTTYFFRKRFPWEQSKTGPFTKEEEQLFFQRYYQLKKMGIVNAQWGFFAIIIVGRVGYQLATFYRTKVNSGEIQDDSFVKDPNGVLKHVIHKHKLDLTEEMKQQMYKEVAMLISEYAQSCLVNAQMQDNGRPVQIKRGRKSTKPQVQQTEPKKTVVKKKKALSNQDEADDEGDADDSYVVSDDAFYTMNDDEDHPLMATRSSSKRNESPKKDDNGPDQVQEEQDSESSSPLEKARRNQSTSKSEEKEVDNGPKQTNPKRVVRSEDTSSSDDSSSSSDLSITAKRRQMKHRKKQHVIDSDSDEEKEGGLYGAYDYLTERPMRHPAMNIEGYVLDFDSWKKILSGKYINPFNTTINSLSELTMITAKNYDELKYDIINSPMY